MPDCVENELALASASWLSGGVLSAPEPGLGLRRGIRPASANQPLGPRWHPGHTGHTGHTGLAFDRRRFASLVQSADINSITSVKCWEGIDLRWFNTLQDTTSMV